MSEDAIGYNLDFAPLVDHVRKSFPGAMQLHVQRGEDGRLMPPLGVQWVSFLPIALLEAMRIQMTVLDPDGALMSPEDYAALVVERLAERDAQQQAAPPTAQ